MIPIFWKKDLLYIYKYLYIYNYLKKRLEKIRAKAAAAAIFKKFSENSWFCRLKFNYSNNRSYYFY